MRHVIHFVAVQDIFLIVECELQGLGSKEFHAWYTLDPDLIVKFSKDKEYLAWVYDEGAEDFFLWEKTEEGSWKQFTPFNLEELSELARDELIKYIDEQVESIETKRPWPDELKDGSDV